MSCRVVRCGAHPIGGEGDLKEKDGDHAGAIELYLRANHPGKAADLVVSQGYARDNAVLDRVASALIKKTDFEKVRHCLLFRSVCLTQHTYTHTYIIHAAVDGRVEICLCPSLVMWTAASDAHHYSMCITVASALIWIG